MFETPIWHNLIFVSCVFAATWFLLLRPILIEAAMKVKQLTDQVDVVIEQAYKLIEENRRLREERSE